MRTFGEEIEISAVGRFDAVIRVPGSKSLTNRALLLAAMARGATRITGALFADDTRAMVQALRQLGFDVVTDEHSSSIVVEGRGGAIPAHQADLFADGAGTVMRFLAGFLTLGKGRYRLDGNSRMRQRPIGPMVAALQSLGLRVSFEGIPGYPPIVVEAGPDSFRGGSCTINAAISSQFVSGLLLPAPLWRDGLRLTVTQAAAQPFIWMTVALMRQWGAQVDYLGQLVSVPGGQNYKSAGRFEIEPDASNASYFAAAAALCGGRVRLPGVFIGQSVQGDVAFLKILEKMGAKVRQYEQGTEISGTGSLCGVDVDMSSIPDMVATLAALAPFASTPTTIRNVGFIRHHESDRLAAIGQELRRLGAVVFEREDGLYIEPSKLTPRQAVETYNDHRIAMAFAVAGLKLGGLRLKNPACVTKTYPTFFDDLASLA